MGAYCEESALLICQSVFQSSENFEISELNSSCMRNDSPNCTLQIIMWYHRCIGTSRAVWVPGQDLATRHLMRNCGKRILSLHCALYVCLCTRMLYAGDHVSLCPVLVI